MAFMHKVQPIFQNPFEAFNPLKRDRSLSVHDTAPVSRPQATRHASDVAVDDALRKVGLSLKEVRRRYPHELSGGQLQRVAIARALLSNPKLIVADEPVSMVDASLRMSIVNLFKTLRDDLGISIIYVTHDLATAYYISDRIMIMQKGSVVESGDARAVLNAPQHPYSRQLRAAVLLPEVGEPAGPSGLQHQPDTSRSSSASERTHEKSKSSDGSRFCHRPIPIPVCSAPSSSISDAASMAASTSPDIRPPMPKVFGRMCSRW